MNLKRRERELVKQLREEGRTDWQKDFLRVFKKNFGYLGKTLDELQVTQGRYRQALIADPAFSDEVMQVKVDLLDAIQAKLIEKSMDDGHLALKVLSKLRREVFGDANDMKLLHEGSVEEANVVEIFEWEGGKVSFPAPKK